MLVEPGWRPHENCNCNTITSEDAANGCKFDFEVSSTYDDGRGGRSVSVLSTIQCPNGEIVTGSGASLSLDRLLSGEGDDFLEMAAHDICLDTCPSGGGDGGDDDFLCC